MDSPLCPKSEWFPRSVICGRTGRDRSGRVAAMHSGPHFVGALGEFVLLLMDPDTALGRIDFDAAMGQPALADAALPSAGIFEIEIFIVRPVQFPAALLDGQPWLVENRIDERVANLF